LEPITHFLTGACLGRAGLNRKTALATATLTLAAEAPDLDVLTSFKDPVFGFAHHRGFTHSFLGLVLVSAAVVALVYFIWQLRGRRIKDPNLPPRWGLLFLYAYFAGLTHILLDFTNNYGVRPFWPFSEKWYSWDIVFIVEPALLIFLTAGLVLPALFGLISNHSQKGPRARLAAILALLGVIAVWGLRDYEHRRAVVALEGRTYQGADPVRASAYPYWWNPFQWYGVVETPDLFAAMRIYSSAPKVDPDGGMKIVPKPEETPVTLAAKKSYLGRVYLDWAQYPVTETEPLSSPEPRYIVHFRDLRYDYPGRTGRGVLGASVGLDSNLNVVSESIGSRTRRP
jgi:inner membrane protein